MIHVLTDAKNDSNISNLIATCKSDSHAVGAPLRHAHYELGRELASTFRERFQNAVAVCFMRGGVSFSLGVADTLDCTVLFFDDKNAPDFFQQEKTQLEGKQVILIDSVINSGKGMLRAIESLRDIAGDIKVMTNVLCHKATDKFEEVDTFTVRISENSFTGSNIKEQNGNKGPDTGDRLFKTGVYAQ